MAIAARLSVSMDAAVQEKTPALSVTPPADEALDPEPELFEELHALSTVAVAAAAKTPRARRLVMRGVGDMKNSDRCDKGIWTEPWRGV